MQAIEEARILGVLAAADRTVARAPRRLEDRRVREGANVPELRDSASGPSATAEAPSASVES
jgi:hypothetical protein